MQIISGTTDFLLQGASAVAIGKFDGMHRGHKALLSEILEAKKRGLQAVVFTFDPPPAVLFSGKAVKGLTTREEKRRLFRQIGIDVLIEFPLTFQTAAISPEDFLRVIVQEQIRAKLVAAGTDLSFGDRGLGDCKLLKARAEAYGYEVKIIDKVLEDGEEISSTRVRQAVEAGKMQEAAKLLGAPYAVMGTVVHGRQLGRTIGFPTVNLMPPADKLLPPNGVYRSEVECSSGVFKGLTNVGVKPTVEHVDHPPMSVETYIYDFSEDIYDSFITVRLLTFERPEQKFADVEELKEQLQRDIAAGAR